MFVLPRNVCRLRNTTTLQNEFIAQHERQATLLKDEGRSLTTRYDSDASEFQSEQSKAVAERLQMKTAMLSKSEYDAARASKQISAL